MIEFVSKKPEITLTLDGTVKVTLTAPRSKVKMLSALADDKAYDVQVKLHREKRSLEANAYAWVLINEMANVLLRGKDDLYVEMLKEYGQTSYIAVRTDVPISGYIKYFDLDEYVELDGVEYASYKVYKGSSEFDTREMSIFLDGIIERAQELGIDTRTPDEVARIKSQWRPE